MNTNPTLNKPHIRATDAAHIAALQERADFYARVIYGAWRGLGRAWQWLARRSHTTVPAAGTRTVDPTGTK